MQHPETGGSDRGGVEGLRCWAAEFHSAVNRMCAERAEFRMTLEEENKV